MTREDVAFAEMQEIQASSVVPNFMIVLCLRTAPTGNFEENRVENCPEAHSLCCACVCL
jgi:hypothetical protein